MGTIAPRFFRLEGAVLVGVCLIYLQYRSRFEDWPKSRRLFHFFLILVFAEIGACGLRSAIFLISGPSRFFEIFQLPNLLQLPARPMCWLASAYAAAGTVFFVAVMFLGELNLKRRGIFFALVGPSAVLYPLMMANFTQTSELLLKYSPLSIVGTFFFFALVAAFGVIFFRSNPQSGASVRQPFRSDTNRSPATAASRRSP